MIKNLLKILKRTLVSRLDSPTVPHIHNVAELEDSIDCIRRLEVVIDTCNSFKKVLSDVITKADSDVDDIVELQNRYLYDNYGDTGIDLNYKEEVYGD